MKKLGQHFLKSRAAIEKIVDALNVTSGDTIVEIGPGHGELTDEVLGARCEVLGEENCKIKLLAIEKDAEFAAELKKKFSENRNIEIIGGDALKILPTITKTYNLKPKTWKLVGNIPYYITGKLLRVLSEMENGPGSRNSVGPAKAPLAQTEFSLPGKPSLCVFTVQKEVAERITAKPPRANKLAAIVQFWAEPELLFVIKKHDFSPPPEVDSAVIRLTTRINADRTPINADEYYSMVRALFAQPRQTILNNICRASGDKKNIGINQPYPHKSAVADKLRRININPQDRPQNLSVEEIIKIARAGF